MEYSTILYNLEEAILTITLNRPELLNAFNRTMMSEIIDALDRADACLLYTSPSPRDGLLSRMPSSA